MRAARLHAAGDLRVGEEPTPEADAGMSLVRVTAVGICGSDLHWWDEGAIGDATLAHPLVLGHEGRESSPGGHGAASGSPSIRPSPAGPAGRAATVRRMNRVYPRAISLAARGVVDLGSLVSSRAGLSSAAAAFGEAARRTGLKVLIEPLRCAVRLGLVRAVRLAAVLDLCCVLAFVIIGRASHAHGESPGGIASTAWPFLAGLASGWLAVRGWRRPLALAPAGVGAWLGAAGLGMALRVVAGQGTAVAFVLVALAFLGLFLLGWRAVARFTRLTLPPGLRRRLPRSPR